MTSSREQVRSHIDKKLQRRLRLYFGISLLLLCAVLFEVFIGIVGFAFALLGILIGLGLGFISARMFHLSWDQDAKKIVSRLDLFGGVILVLYILFAVFRSRIIGHFIHGPAVGGVSISIVTGIMIGRFFGTRGRIRKILEDQQVF